MSRITKAIAEEMAYKLLEKKREKNEKRLEEIQAIITAVQEAKVPLHIMKAFNDPSTKGYIEIHDQVNVNGQGLNYDRIKLNRKVPEATGQYCPSILLEDSTALLISKKLEVWKNHQEKYRELLTKTEATLMALRSYKKVHDLFPDAAKYLPPVQQTCADLQCISSIVNEINTDE